jgi:hypothetical protein
MNLKLVVASMSILGLVSCPVFADAQAKKNHHAKKHHRAVKHHKVKHQDYKDMGSLPVQPAPVEACSVSQANLILAKSNQNLGRMANPCNPGWFNRIQVSGGLNVDVGKWGNRNANIMGENYQRLSLNDLHLEVTATVNEWVKAFGSLSYNTATINDPTTGGAYALATGGAAHVSEYDAAYSNNVSSGSSNTFQVEQAFVTIGNLDSSPFYVQAGKQFQDYSQYPLHPITESFTQVLSKTLATSAKVGFVTNGFHGSVAAFDNPTAKVGQTNKPTDYVAALGYDQVSDQLGFDVGVSYMYDMNGVNDVAYAVNQFTGGGFHSRTSAVALYGDVNSGPFTVGARWTRAMQRFNPLDLPKNGVADAPGAVVSPAASGAKPWAFGIQAGFNFEPIFGCNKNNVYVGWQSSQDAAGLGLAKSRWLAGYDVEVWKSTKLGVEWDRDIAYGTSRGGSGSNSNLVSLRAGVEFG